jgi:hypothetical protein
VERFNVKFSFFSPPSPEVESVKKVGNEKGDAEEDGGVGEFVPLSCVPFGSDCKLEGVPENCSKPI